MKEEKKVSFWRKIVISIKDFETYIELAASKAKTTLLYIMGLIAIFTVAVTAIFIYDMSRQVDEVRNYIENEISEILYENGILQIADNKPIIIENEGNMINKVIIDTSEIENIKEEEYINKVKETTNGILILRDKIILKSAASSALISYSYNEFMQMYGVDNFDKTYILEQFSGTNILIIYIVMFMVAYLYLYIIYFINILLNILLLATIGNFTAILLRLRLRYSAMCNIAAYSLTLPVILNIIYVLLNTFTGLYIKYFDIMYIAISYIYIITTILLIKADMIKKGKELAKIIEEQEKVRQEMERQKEEEKQKEEQREKEKKKQEEEQKEKQNDVNKKTQKKGKIGSEPQGDNV